mmetsp:Transcript_31803/g.65535  ORF Transcript_31803/g.65535 Transcript_31803/m.65535 type:complete len:85 (-) Transcript_31803:66-320(-)
MSGFGRILANLADRYLTEKIANSPTMQRVAYKSVESVKGLKDKAAVNASQAAQSATQQGGTVRQFLRAMKEEALKDAQAIKGKK